MRLDIVTIVCVLVGFFFLANSGWKDDKSKSRQKNRMRFVVFLPWNNMRKARKSGEKTTKNNL